MISPDSIEYLDPSSINGLNLYSYANNNPIGTAICPGLGTAIGFTVGLVGSILGDIFLGEWIADWIDNNVK